MFDKNLLLGIDIGGTGCKAAVYDHGSCLGQGYREYQMVSERTGQAEQDGEEWWQAAVAAIRQAIGSISTGRIVAVGIGCTNGLICVDKNAKPIRPAIMLWDQRAYPQADFLQQSIGKDKIFQITGNPAAPGTYSLPSLLWLKKNEPKTFEDAHKFMVPGGYLVARLTGEFTIDQSRACTTMLFDIRQKKWHDPFLKKLGIPCDKLPRVMSSTQIVGQVSSEAATLTGLPQGLPVIAGCMDTVGAAVGAGSIRTGDYFIIMGTAARVCITIDQPDFDPSFMNCVSIPSNNWLAFGAINGVGASLRWVRDVIALEETKLAQRDGMDIYDIITTRARDAKPGSKGLIYLPYISGERTPIWDPKARGLFFGLSLGHTRAELYRSVLEGTAYAIRQSLELLQNKYQLPVHNLKIGGTAAKNDVWNQIISDVLGLPLYAIKETHIEVLGAALLAGVGVGTLDINKLSLKGTRYDLKMYEPDPENHRLYSELFSIYKSLHPSLVDQFHQLTQIKKILDR